MWREPGVQGDQGELPDRVALTRSPKGIRTAAMWREPGVQGDRGELPDRVDTGPSCPTRPVMLM